MMIACVCGGVAEVAILGSVLTGLTWLWGATLGRRKRG